MINKQTNNKVFKTTFNISKMDCPSEELIIRMKLDNFDSIKNLEFDMGKRELTVFHTKQIKEIEKSLDELKMGSLIVDTQEIENLLFNEKEKDNSKKLLINVLLINFLLFLFESTTGFISNSMGLIADSLDMLADSIVYSLSLYALGRTEHNKKNVARISGYFQILLACIGVFEVIKRFMGYEEIPEFKTMIIISIIALIGNVISLNLLKNSENTQIHMKASMIFTSNDIIANLGVILAGIIVYFTSSNKPDLIIGILVFILVFKGALRILKLSR